MGKIAIILLLLATGAYGAEYPEIRQPYTGANETFLTDDRPVFINQFEHVPMCKITFRGGNDKEGTLNFCGDKLTYTGELPADEAAKIFFDGILKQHIQCVGRKPEKK